MNKKIRKLSPPLREQAQVFVQSESALLEMLQCISRTRLSCLKTRIHGDFHLAQVLFTGKDFMFVDFEGESERTIGDRRLKRSCLRDVAGMLFSLHNAAYCAQNKLPRQDPPDTDTTAWIESWGLAWIEAAWNEFLQAYLETVHGASLAPLDRGAQQIMLACFLLERACIEVEREMAGQHSRTTAATALHSGFAGKFSRKLLTNYNIRFSKAGEAALFRLFSFSQQNRLPVSSSRLTWTSTKM